MKVVLLKLLSCLTRLTHCLRSVSGSAHGHSVPESGASPSRGSGSVWRQFSGVLGKVGAAIPLPKPKNQAKLGEENTMYYDEKLGRWVEPGKEGEADAGPPPPPPTTLGASPIPSGTGAAGTAHTRSNLFTRTTPSST